MNVFDEADKEKDWPTDDELVDAVVEAFGLSHSEAAECIGYFDGYTYKALLHERQKEVAA